MKDQVVVIAGGSGEIGQAAGSLFARAGARVVLAARDRAKAEAAAAAMNAAGGEAYVADLDVTDAESVQAMTRQVAEELGRIDVLVNAFGVGMILPLEQAETPDIERVMQVNATGTILVTQAVVRVMKQQKSGRVIQIPGIVGKYVMRGSSVYSASKFAVAGFTKAMVEETKRDGIGFSLLYLGGVATGFWDSPLVQMRVQKEKMLTPAEVAKAIYYAASQPAPGVLNELVIQPDSHQMV